jgi:hypothetical protein
MGAIIRQGPHHGAQQSSSTGRLRACKTSRSKVASVTTSGRLVFALAASAAVFNAAPHLPQTGRRARAARSSTRFFAPHFAQAKTTMRFFSFNSKKPKLKRYS